MVHAMSTSAPLIHDEFRFGDAEFELFERQGYYIFEHCLTDEALEEGRRHIDRMIGERAEGFLGTEMMSPHQLGEKWMWDIITDPKILDFAERRLGPNVVLWHADVLNKEPETGREILWHQDQMYWDRQHVHAPLAGLWIPFDDVDETNGTMSVLPFEHRRGLLPTASIEGDFFGYSVDPAGAPSRCRGARSDLPVPRRSGGHAQLLSSPSIAAQPLLLLEAGDDDALHARRCRRDGRAPLHELSRPEQLRPGVLPGSRRRRAGTRAQAQPLRVAATSSRRSRGHTSCRNIP